VTATPPRGAPRLSFSLVLAQVGITVTVALLALAVGGMRSALSALLGAGVAGVTTFYASRRASVPEHSVGAALRRVMIGEFIKILSTIALFAAAARVPHLVWPALLCGYAAALVASWLPSMRERAVAPAADGVRVTNESGL